MNLEQNILLHRAEMKLGQAMFRIGEVQHENVEVSDALAWIVVQIEELEENLVKVARHVNLGEPLP